MVNGWDDWTFLPRGRSLSRKTPPQTFRGGMFIPQAGCSSLERDVHPSRGMPRVAAISVALTVSKGLRLTGTDSIMYESPAFVSMMRRTWEPGGSFSSGAGVFWSSRPLMKRSILSFDTSENGKEGPFAAKMSPTLHVHRPVLPSKIHRSSYSAANKAIPSNSVPKIPRPPEDMALASNASASVEASTRYQIGIPYTRV
jgi:hypothetical protein